MQALSSCISPICQPINRSLGLGTVGRRSELKTHPSCWPEACLSPNLSPQIPLSHESRRADKFDRLNPLFSVSSLFGSVDAWINLLAKFLPGVPPETVRQLSTTWLLLLQIPDAVLALSSNITEGQECGMASDMAV
jgi:hypothetical protein